PQQPQTTHIGGGGDSGNASASSSVFASPQQHSVRLSSDRSGGVLIVLVS
uniref:GAE domain-containing protein n=1 Tax=Globodera pallida TaxID=36090 RepID=A0A183CTK8_GLOPA